MKNPLAQRMLTGLLTLLLVCSSGPGVTSVAVARTLTESSGAQEQVLEPEEAVATDEVSDGQTSDSDLDVEKPSASEAEAQEPAASLSEQALEQEAPATIAASEELEARLDPQALRRDGQDSWVAAGDFLVSGGTAGVDYQFTSPTLHILTSTPLTVKNANAAAATSHNIEIDAGVKADLTLAGVNITTPSASVVAPINLVTNSDEDGDGIKVTNANQIVRKTTLYLTLADGTTNNLTCGNQSTTGSAAIRCGWGSVLVIDDGIPNVRAGGSKFNLDDIVTPVNGMVEETVTLLDGTALSAGCSPVEMDAVIPGVLNAQGGGHSAGIGSAANENAGTMIFNGGTILSRSCQINSANNNWGCANGAGIGSGSGGSGTIMIFNGGNINAYAGSCGAGIGSALGYFSTDHINGVPKADAISIPNNEAASGGYSFIARPDQVDWFCCHTTQQTCPNGVHYIQGATSNNYFTVAGDITVNGGFIYAHSGKHGNAFGQSCAHGPSSNHNHIVRVTGGTLLTETNDITSTNPPRAALGAAFGYTIVTGGSVRLQLKNGKPAFQGLGNTAYNTAGIEEWSDVEAAGGSLPDSDKVQMVEIDLSSEFATGENKTVPITKWKLEIDNIPQNYGSPSYLDDGKLYLWLPESATGKHVSVTLSYRDNQGNEKNIEPLYVEEVGGSSGSLLKRYIDIEVDKLPPDLQAYFGSLTKPYDGLPFETLDVSKTPIDTSPFEGSGKLLNDASKVTVSYQQYDERDGSPLPNSAVISNGRMPADTGIFKFELLSKQFADPNTDFGKTYWGHRIAGWSEITPVPAVLTMQEVEWGHLDETTGDWQPITQDNAEGKAGNRLKLTFNIRSANTTATTCAAPTGSFQISIDGKEVGSPVALTPEAIEASTGSTISNPDLAVTSPSGGTETRHATQVTYYFDPTNNDGLMDLLKGAASGVEHTVNLEYLADKNYIQGADKNPENKDEGSAFIVPVTPESQVTGDGVDITDDPVTSDPSNPDAPGVPDYPLDPYWPFNPYDPADPTNPLNPSAPADPDDPSDPGQKTPDAINPEQQKTKIVRKTINALYSDFHKADEPDLPSTFTLQLKSDSSAPISFYNVNDAVADYVRGADGVPQLTEDGALEISVNSCGTTVLVMDQGANAFYNGTRYIITVNIAPDPTLRPQVQVRLTWRNLTAMGLAQAPAAQAQTFSALKFAPASFDAASLPSAASALAARAGQEAAAESRADTPPRPGDTLEYTVSGLNITPGSAWRAGELIDYLKDHLEFNDDSVQLAANYPTHSDKTYLGTPAFYQGFDWDGLAWQDVAPKSDQQQDGYDFDGSAVTKAIGTVYGGQSTSVRFTAQVQPGTASRPDPDEGLETLKPQHDASGSDADIHIIDDKGFMPDPDNPGEWIAVPGNPNPEDGPKGDPAPSGETPIIPADPKDGSLVTQVKVVPTEKVEEHEDDRILVGDKIKVTVTSENVEPDSKLADAVIKVVVPEGIEPLPGTLRLTDATGKVYEVPDSAYDPETGIIAVNAGDIYGGETAQLTFDAEVLSTQETRRDEDPQYPNRPSDMPIDASTYGDTPTEEWRNQHEPDPDDPDNPGSEDPDNPGDNPGGSDKPYEKPVPGTPYNPQDQGKTWEEVEEKKKDGPTSDPLEPPVLPATPNVSDNEEESDIKISKTADNLTRSDGSTYVGDQVGYTVVVRNIKAHTAWYNTVICDQLPQGLEPVAGSFRLVDPSGNAYELPDDVYDPTGRLISVSAGTLLGGTSATLTFTCTVTETALGADIGNVASATGESPAGIPIDAPTKAPVTILPAQRFDPEEGWEEYLARHNPISNGSNPAYAPGTSATQSPKAAPADTSDGGTGATTNTVKPKSTSSRLVPTGDETSYLPLTLGLLALAGVAAAAVLLVKERS